MKISNYVRAAVTALVIAVTACVAVGINRGIAQNAGQYLFTPTGKELIQVIPPNTAAIAYTSISSLRDGRMWVYNVPITGFTLTLTVDQSVTSLNPAGTLASGTIVFPATGVDGKSVSIWSSQTITALTLSTTNGATFVPAAPTTIAAAAQLEFVYDLANNQWHRFQ